jgi:Raf kinase inhibitor-like YbhB/YbcL family protein
MAMDRKLLEAAAALLVLVMLVRPGTAQAAKLDIRSPVFANGDRIPAKYTCDGEDVSPPMDWSKGPTATESYAVIVDDPDAPRGTFTHWVIYNIPYNVTRFEEYVTAVDRLDDGTLQGTNHFGRIGYGGPCPPPGKPHHYRFNVYALDTRLSLGPGATKEDLLKAMSGHVLAQGELIGVYGR